MPDRHFRGLRGNAKPWKRKRAAQMSRNKTRTEKLLWAKLKDKQLGVNIHGQRVILGYIVDFWCPKAGLVVEVDGSSHRRRKAWDRKRDAALRAKGIETMRFSTGEVENNLPAVVALIRDRIERRRA